VQTKKLFKSGSNSHISLFCSFEIETVNTFIHSRLVVLSKTIPDSRSKWAKCIPVFRRKWRKNPSRWGGTYLYGLYKGVPPGTLTGAHYKRAWCTCKLCKISYTLVMKKRLGVYLRFRNSLGKSEQILFLSEWVVCWNETGNAYHVNEITPDRRRSMAVSKNFLCLIVKEKKIINWRPVVAIWRLKLFIYSSDGAYIKMLILDPVK